MTDRDPADDIAEDKSVRVKRLRFRAWRRGFVEADLLLGGFADERGDDLSAQEIEQFEALLEAQDQDVYAWILGAQPAPAEHDHALLAQLRAFSREDAWKMAKPKR